MRVTVGFAFVTEAPCAVWDKRVSPAIRLPAVSRTLHPGLMVVRDNENLAQEEANNA
jgi:hypothetical protein